MDVILKPEPEIVGNEIRVRMKNPDLFIKESFRTISISKEKGIKSIIGKLKSDPEGSTVIQSYRFDKNKWTVEEAVKWVKENEKKTIESLILLYKEIDISGNTDRKEIKYYSCKVLKIDKDEHVAKIKVTNEDIDRDGEIILLSSWQKRSKSYNQHPVLLSSHKYDKLTHQIGEAVNIDWTKMEFDFKWYAGEGNPEADWGWKLAEKGKAMFSVGFIPFNRFIGDAIPEEYRGKKPQAVLDDNELLEVSQVVVGSNRGALQMGIDNPNPEQCQYMYEVVKSFGNEIPEFSIIKDTTKEKFECECIKCGFKMTSDKHCKDIKCEKCGGQMRRVERPGPGQAGITDDSIIISPIEVQNLKELNDIMEIWKSGRIISEKNRTVIKSTILQLSKSVEVLNILLQISEPKNNPKEEGGKNIDFDVDSFLSETKKSLEKFNNLNS